MLKSILSRLGIKGIIGGSILLFALILGATKFIGLDGGQKAFEEMQNYVDANPDLPFHIEVESNTGEVYTFTKTDEKSWSFVYLDSSGEIDTKVISLGEEFYYFDINNEIEISSNMSEEELQSDYDGLTKDEIYDILNEFHTEAMLDLSDLKDILAEGNRHFDGSYSGIDFKKKGSYYIADGTYTDGSAFVVKVRKDSKFFEMETDIEIVSIEIAEDKLPELKIPE